MIRRIKLRTKRRHSVYRTRPLNLAELTRMLKAAYLVPFTRALKRELRAHRRLRIALGVT